MIMYGISLLECLEDVDFIVFQADLREKVKDHNDSLSAAFVFQLSHPHLKFLCLNLQINQESLHFSRNVYDRLILNDLNISSDVK
jgi:hypothetical protein